MTEDFFDDKGNEEESFEKLLESYGDMADEALRVGEKITARIIAIGKDTVFLDTGTKIDGIVEKEELLDDTGSLPYEVGDTLELYVISFNEGELRLSRAMSGIGGLNLLRDAFREQVPVEGKVVSVIKGGYQVDAMHRRAFCPASQIDLKYSEKQEEYVGRHLRFLITQLDDNGRNIVLSRRKLLERELEVSRKEFLDSLKPEAILAGKITRIMPYGAFVELFPGIEGMVHVSELSWSRVESAEEIAVVGQEVRVKVLSIESAEKPGQKRIALSVKQATADPWETVSRDFKEGQIVKGKVRRLASFGAFVEIAPGIEGLVHISEMSYTKRILKPEEILAQGQQIKVMIKEINSDSRRISLSLKDVEGDPWADVLDKYVIGQRLQGRLEKKENFGFFVSLEPGITGLLPRSRIQASPHAAELDKLKQGDTIPVTIEAINQEERKITLSPDMAGDEEDWKKFTINEQSLGSLGEKLQQALKAKKKN